MKEGFSVSLARDANTEKAVDNPQPYEDVMTNVSAAAALDKISVSFHGYAHTHFDGLAHHFMDGKMYKRDIALLGSESALSAVPIPPQFINKDDYLPVHNFVLVVLGMNLFDDCDLDALADAAAARKRWEFLLTAAPLPMPRGTGSPINPIAVF